MHILQASCLSLVHIRPPTRHRINCSGISRVVSRKVRSSFGLVVTSRTQDGRSGLEEVSLGTTLADLPGYCATDSTARDTQVSKPLDLDAQLIAGNGDVASLPRAESGQCLHSCSICCISRNGHRPRVDGGMAFRYNNFVFLDSPSLFIPAPRVSFFASLLLQVPRGRLHFRDSPSLYAAALTTPACIRRQRIGCPAKSSLW